MTITCFIRYWLDPSQLDTFCAYAENWVPIIPRCGGHLIGYFVPQPNTGDIGWGLIAFDNMDAYHDYRARLLADPEAIRNFEMAKTNRFILREERAFLKAIESTLNLPSTLVLERESA